MSNRALMVGINKYPGAPLNGCVNDIQDMAKYLVSHCGFKSSEIRLLTDERATTQAILLRLHDLVSGLKAGDRVLFHYSGHGAQTAIRGSNGIPTRMADCVCLTGDTKIPLLDGTEITIAEMVAKGGEFDVYSTTLDGHIRSGKAIFPRKTGVQREILRVTLDNGETVRCTPNHLWLLRDGTYLQASELTPGQSLMPLYRYEEKLYGSGGEYERIYNPATKSKEWMHHLTCGVCPQDILGRARSQGCGVVRHHKNFNKLDNRPANLQWMTWRDHASLHLGSPESRACTSERFRFLWKDETYRSKMVERMSKGAFLRWCDPEYRNKISAASKCQDLSLMREGFQKYSKALPPETRVERARFAGVANKGVSKCKAYSQKLSTRWQDPEYRATMSAAQRESALRRWQDPEYRVRMSEMSKKSRAREKSEKSPQPNNHKIVAVEHGGYEDVYDVTVPVYENFAVSAGVFLHNCPVDFDWSSQRMITDTQFHDIFKLIPAGVDFTWVSDSCHSGDLSLNKGAMNVRSKSYPVPVDIAWRVQSAHDLGLAPTGMAPPQATPLNLAFVSGCGSKQTSADAFFGGRYNGACTYYLLHELNKPLSNPLTAIVGNMVNDLHTDGYDQKPELHGLDALKNRPFLA